MSGRTENGRGHAGGKNKYVERGSAPFSERAKSSDVGTKALVRRQKKRSEWNGSVEVADGKENAGTVAPRLGPQRTPEAICVVGRTSGEKWGKEGRTVRQWCGNEQGKGPYETVFIDGGCKEVKLSKKGAE